MQRAPGTDGAGGSLIFCEFCFLLLGFWLVAFVLVSPALVSAVSTILLVRVEPCLLVGCQDRANLRALLCLERSGLGGLMSLFHVGAETCGVTLLAGGAG